MNLLKKLISACLLNTAVLFPAYAADKDIDIFRSDFVSGKLSWSEVEKRAREEGTVNWFHWGGSEQLNSWIERVVVPKMADKGITLKTTRIAGTRDAVDLVLTELAAGRELGHGSVDAIWLNGDNFYTLSKQEALFGSFADKVPNSKYFEFDQDNPRAQLNLSDFGTPTQAREMPWSGEQYICYLDSKRLSRANAPKDFVELEIWLEKNPGRFTYVKPPHYIGNTFVQTALYSFNPSGQGYKEFQRPITSFTADEFTKLVQPGFEYLKRIEPHLLGGDTPFYPQNQSVNQSLYNNGEVDFACEFGLYLVHNNIKTGTFSETTETLAFPSSGMIKNKNFLAIPKNAPHPAAALVFTNVMSSLELQISKLKDIGYPLGADIWKLSGAEALAAKAAEPALHGVTADELGRLAVSDTNASLVKVIEKIWVDYIEKKSSLPFGEIVAKQIVSN
ncbi:MAG: ABC transporter substrate-binding protein [Sneathiella sp.]|nr:ABC transporter substrate-binding protein [Sneathiella sp.]